MLLSDERRKVMETLILSGESPDALPDICQKMGVGVDADMIKRWQKTLKTPSKIAAFSSAPKLINRFSLGADPEFFMANPISGEYLYAESLGLDTLSAFGCDMSGRQAELRVHPSKFVLEAIASVVDTLRWMYAFGGHARQASWLAVPFVNANERRDGAGGHLHLGRKRPARRKEVGRLDGVSRVLLEAGVLDREGQDNRRANTDYGKASDYRPQVHGYEYRSLPTWLSSPEVAFMTMTAAKLAVLLPESLKAVSSVQQLKNLIYSFKHRDDDAAIMTRYIERLGLPKFDRKDFKKVWGVGAEKVYGYTTHYIPESIPPDKTTMKEVFDWLVYGIAMPIRVPNITWPLFKLPPDYQKVSIEPHTYGTAEVAMGLLSHKCHVKVCSGSRYGVKDLTVRTNCWQEPEGFGKALNEIGLPTKFSVMYEPSKTPPYLNITLPMTLVDGHNVQGHMVVKLQHLFCGTGLFPIVHADNINKVLFKESYLVEKKPVAPKRIMGKIRFEENGGL